jgi:hypothetical protein
VAIHNRRFLGFYSWLFTLRRHGIEPAGRQGMVMKIMGENYRVDELAAEAGRLVLFILAGGAWTFLMILLALE